MQLARIGSDPEMFVSDGFNIGHAIGMIGGTKQQPLVVRRGALQEDNVLLEFNTDPTDQEGEFLECIREVMQQASDRIMYLGLELVPNVSSHVYPMSVLSEFPPLAFTFGCTPDFNALTGDKNPAPAAADPGLRTAGGHVHIGWDHLGTVTKEDQEKVGVMCDYFLGLPSLMMDDDDQRRELYGKACAIRYKPYGVEYRTLSNFWIWEDSTVLWAFRQAQKAYNAALSYGELLRALVPPQDVQVAINTNDRALAKAMLEVLDNAEQY